MGTKPGQQSAAFPTRSQWNLWGRKYTKASTNQFNGKRASLTTLLCKSVCSILQCVCPLNSYTSSSCPGAISHSLLYCHDHRPTKGKRVNSIINEKSCLPSLPHTNNVNKLLFQELNWNHWQFEESVLLDQYTYTVTEVKDISYFDTYTEVFEL